jgi:hypothetical protein
LSGPALGQIPDPKFFLELQREYALKDYKRLKKGPDKPGKGDVPEIYTTAARTPLRQAVPPEGKVVVQLRGAQR